MYKTDEPPPPYTPDQGQGGYTPAPYTPAYAPAPAPYTPAFAPAPAPYIPAPYTSAPAPSPYAPTSYTPDHGGYSPAPTPYTTAPAPYTPNPYTPAPHAPDQGEAGYDGMGSSFSDKAVRLGFIRKVYSILTAQLVLTMAFIGLFFLDSVKGFTAANQWIVWVAIVMSFVFLIILACCPGVSRKSPHNMIFLGLFTCCEGFMLGTITARYEAAEVLLAVGFTAAVVLALTLFAFQTKIDFTACGGALLCVLVIFILAGFVAAFFPQTRTVRLVYACIGAVIFSLYIVYDTQIMIGGNHKYSLDPEEYVFAALNLYLDIVNLFIYILQIIGAARD